MRPVVGAVVFAGALAVGLIAAFIYASRASKALFLIYGDRAIIDSRPQGAGGRRVAFGVLLSSVDEANPDCVTFNRG
jgi:hypothetical protein